MRSLRRFGFAFPFVLVICAFVSCATLGNGTVSATTPSTTKTPVLFPGSKLTSADLGKSDGPVISTPEEVLEFSRVDADPYYLGPGDVLKLRASNNEFPEEEIRVTPDSKVTVPILGEIALGRVETKDLETDINTRLKKYYTNIDCKLILLTANNRKVSLLGAVRTPGIIPLEGTMSLIDVIAKAGGFEGTLGETPAAMQRTKLLCRVLRDNGKTIWVDLKAILFQNAAFYNIRIKNNDIIFVYRQ